MIPAAFSYQRPSTVKEALELLRESGGEARLLAGGHSLLPMMKLRLSQPESLIDIGRLTELKGITVDDDRMVIGALTTYSEVAASDDVNRYLPVLAEAAAAIGDLQVRNRGTVGGNLAHADPASDMVPVALALEGSLRIAGQDGERTVAMDEFILGPMLTALGPDEMVTGVELPILSGRTGSVYEKYPHPASGYAVVGVACVVSLGSDGAVESVRVGITGAGEAPYRARALESALIGKQPDDGALEEAAAKADADTDLASDLFASAEYRGHLARVYARRALKRAVAKARDNGGS